MEDNSGYDTELQKHHEPVYFKARALQSAAAEIIFFLNKILFVFLVSFEGPRYQCFVHYN